jgi:hypothetical protein
LSEIRVTTVSDTAGTGPVTLTKQSAAKAWLKVTKSSDTINDSFSITSITDTATGKTSVNSAVTFGSTNGSLLGTNNQSSTALGVYVNWSSTTAWNVFTKDSGGSFVDHDWSSVIHGDLA